MTIKQDDNNADQFWAYIESKMYCTVPKYLKNLLRIRGLDDVINIQSINNEMIKNLELFVKSGGLEPFIPDNADLKDFYWLFHQIPHKFQLVAGHIVLLKYIVAYVTAQATAKGPNFFKSE